MKKILVVFAALCILSMGACFSPWDGSGEGAIVISLGDGGARAAANGNEYTVIVTNSNSGETAALTKITGGKATFSVQPGQWNVVVRREDAGRLNGYGEKNNVEVKAGATASASIDMRDLVEVGGNWGDLKTAIEGAQAELVMLTSEKLTVNDSIEIPHGKSITLLSKNPVTIIKGTTFPNSMFRVPRSSSLTLGVAGGMEGTITFDGDGRGSSSLIYVGTTRINPGKNSGDGGKLAMYDGVTLTNNRATIDDRGGGVVVQGGTFNMYGGTISGNTAVRGGGVRVLSGTFKKTGGTIYGSDGGENKNTATEGHAVYFDGSKKAIDATLGSKDNL